MGLDPNIELFAMDDSPTRPAAAAPYQNRSNSTVDNDNSGDSEQNYRRMPAPSPIRNSYDNEPGSTMDTDPFVVNIQRTLVRDDTGARYPVSYQATAVRMSYAHALEQPSPYDSAPLVCALFRIPMSTLISMTITRAATMTVQTMKTTNFTSPLSATTEYSFWGSETAQITARLACTVVVLVAVVIVCRLFVSPRWR